MKVNRARGIKLQFYVNAVEEKQLNDLLKKYNIPLGAYIRDKLIYSNEDIDDKKIFISPEKNKDSLVNITLSYRILEISRYILSKLNCNENEIYEIEQMALDYAKAERAKAGYHLIDNTENEAEK